MGPEPGLLGPGSVLPQQQAQRLESPIPSTPVSKEVPQGGPLHGVAPRETFHQASAK